MHRESSPRLSWVALASVIAPAGEVPTDAMPNHCPVLTGLTASPSRVDAGQTVGCTSSLEDTPSSPARFTPAARPTGDACENRRLVFIAVTRALRSRNEPAMMVT